MFISYKIFVNVYNSFIYMNPVIHISLKKIGKTTRPFRYDLKCLAVEVTNRYKGLDLIEFLKNYGWRFMTLHRRQ